MNYPLFNVRLLKEQDYTTLCKWWNNWRWSAPAKDFLPEHGTGGLMVSKGEIEIVAGFIYFTNSKVCWSEFIISNFGYKEKDRQEAIKILIHELGIIAKNKGYKYIYSTVKNQNLQKLYQEMGYIQGSVKVNEMVFII